jgi:hypothetical protein
MCCARLPRQRVARRAQSLYCAACVSKIHLGFEVSPKRRNKALAPTRTIALSHWRRLYWLRTGAVTRTAA